MSSQLTDKELWTEISSDNSRAFVVLYNRYWKKVYKTSSYYLKDKTAAEEITHDVFVVLWERRKFLKIENFQNYLHATTRYHVFKHLKAAKINCIEYINEYQEHHEQAEYNLADEKIYYEDLESELAQILTGLPGRCREIFWLSRIKQLTNDEITVELGISKRTVENQLTHALKHLRSCYPKMAAVSLSIVFILFLR